MFRKLLPRQDDFFLFFEKHAVMMIKAAREFYRFSKKEIDTKELYHFIRACEEEADDLTHSCIELLHKNFITPIERGDVHKLISTMDDVIDELNTVAKFLVIYKIESFENEAIPLTEILVKATEAISSAINEMRKMNLHSEVIQTQFFTIGSLENQADTLFVQALGRLFDDVRDPLYIIKWKDIYEHIEKAINACDDVGNIIEGILLENE